MYFTTVTVSSYISLSPITNDYHAMPILIYICILENEYLITVIVSYNFITFL